MKEFFLLLEICKIPEIIGALFSIIIKEYSKGFISTKLGDPLPKINDAITLNPKKYIDLPGFILMIFFGYGWNKPIETTSLYYKNRKIGTIITHTLPLLINILVGLLLIFILQLSYNIKISTFNSNILQLNLFFQLLLSKIAIMNFRLALVNLIPIYPFEGSKILKLALTPNFIIKFISMEKIFLIIFIFFTVTGNVGHILDSILNKIIYSIINLK